MSPAGVCEGRRWPARTVDVFAGAWQEPVWPWSESRVWPAIASPWRFPVVAVRPSELWATQRPVFRKWVEFHARRGSLDMPDDEPLVVRYRARLWVVDGHHRCALAVLTARPTVNVRLADLDAMLDERGEAA